MEYRVPEPSLPDDDPAPPTEPKGALVPPPRLPPTAVSAAAAGPEPRPPRPERQWLTGPDAPRRTFLRALNGALDFLDGLADALRSLCTSVARIAMLRGAPN